MQAWHGLNLTGLETVLRASCLAVAALAAAWTGAAEGDSGINRPTEAGQEAVFRVKTETFRAEAKVGQEAQDDVPVRAPASPQREFALPEPTAGEIRQARSEQAPPEEAPPEAGGASAAPTDAVRARIPTSSEFDDPTAGAAKPRRHQVGIGRDFIRLTGAEPRSNALKWQRQPDGGLALALAVRSRGAKALRAQIDLRGVPAGLQVRVFDPAAPATTLVAVPAPLLVPDPNGAATVWTPTVGGDTLAVELYLPPGTPSAGLRATIPRLSHLAVEPFHSSQIGQSRCTHRDAVCLADDISAAARSAVAKYFFTTSYGHTFNCTGTLLNDADASSQVPYFLTAEHCIGNQGLASTMEFYWFFERPECGSGDVSTTRQAGGATLLARDPSNREGTGLDQALLRLNTDPPAGVGLAGWLATAPNASGEGVGVHHPAGDLKKAHSGRLWGFRRWERRGFLGFVVPDENGAHIAHRPTVATEGGSSGSGLWQRIDGYDYLLGVLTGSTAWNCVGSSFYGRLDRFYPQISQWLGSAERMEDSDASRIGRVVLVDAATRAEVADLTGGRAAIDLDETATRSFDVVAKMTLPVGRVSLTLSGAQTAEHASDWAPHTLFGPFGGTGLGPGNYTVTVTTYTEAGSGGTAMERVDVPFTVTGTGTDALAVADLAVAVGSGPRVRALADGAALTTYAGEVVELRARTEGGAVGSVVFSVSGASSFQATASEAPFSVPVTLAAGTYRIAATPYPEKDGEGTAGEAFEVQRVVVTTSASPIAGFTLVNAANDLPDPDLGPLADGAVVDLSATVGLASVRANLAAAAADVERVVLELEGEREWARTESSAPYALFGESSGDYTAQGFPDGEYELTARTFVGGGPRDALPPAKVAFTVTGGGFTSPVESLVLVNATGPAPDPDIQTITDGATLDLSATSGWANIRADLAAARTDIQSVRLELSGGSDAERLERVAPHTLFGNTGGDYSAGLLRNGSHTLTATGYTEPGGGGYAYPPTTVAFTVTGSTWSPVTGVMLVDARGGPPDPDLRPIEDGATVSLAETEDVSIRILAMAHIGFMDMELDGPVWYRWGEDRPFALWGAESAYRPDFKPGRLPDGKYTLTAQPYDLSIRDGTELPPLAVSFTVTDSPSAPTRVTGFTLLDAAGDGPDVDLAPIAHRGTLIIPNGSDGRFNVRANLSSATGIRRVAMYFRPEPVSKHFDDDAPFTAFRRGRESPLAPDTYFVNAQPFNTWFGRMTPQAAEFTVTADNAAARFAVQPRSVVLKEGGSQPLVVSLSKARFARPQELTLAVTGSMSAADYTLEPTTLALPAGATEARALFTLVDDDEREGTERATVQVRHDGKVVGNARFTSVPNDLSENARLASLSLTGVDFGPFDADTTAYAASVPHDVLGTTVAAQAADPHARRVEIQPADADAQTAGHQVPLAVGENRVAVTVTAEIGRQRTYVVTVTRAAAPAATLSATATTVAEGASAAFEATLSTALAAPLTVPVSVSAEGIELSGAAPTSVTFAAGETTASLSVATVDDAVVSGDGAVTAALAAGDGYALGAAASATVTVTEDDTAEFSVSAEPAAIEEGSSSTVTVSIGNGVTYAAARELALSVTGDVAASDYELPATLELAAGASSATAAFAARSDEEAEEAETATVTARLDGAEIGAATLTVTDPAPPPEIRVEGVPQVGATLAAALGGSAGGGGTAGAGPAAARAGAKRAPANGKPAELAYQWLRDGAPIPGATRSQHVLTPADEGAAVSVRASRAGLSASSAATVPVWGPPSGPAARTDEATLLATTMTLDTSDELRVDLAGYMDEAHYEPFGSLDAAAFELDGVRYRLTTLAVTHFGGFGLATVPALPSAAGLAAYWNGHRVSGFESAEGLDGWLMWETYTTQPSAEWGRYFGWRGGVLHGPSDGVRVAVSLRREVGLPVATVAAVADGIDEGGTASFAVALDGAREAPVTVALKVVAEGAALADAAPASVTFAPGETEAALDLATADDAVVSGDGTVTVTLAAGDGYELGEGATATVSVAEDDVAEFAVSASPTELVEGGSSTVTVSIGNGVTFAEAQEIALAVTGDVSADDYSLVPAAPALAAGAASASAVFTAIEDSEPEPEETATVTASLAGEAVGSVTLTVAAGAPSADASLASLALSGVDIGTFNAETTTYTATVSHGVDTTTVTALATDAGARVEIAPADANAAEPGDQVALAVGTNRIAVTVTAADGTQRVYTVTVTREGSAEPVTASFTNVPSGHDGSAFTAGLDLSEEVDDVSYAWVRDTLAAAADGTVVSAKRADASRNRSWRIAVEPASAGRDVVLSTATGATLPDGRAVTPAVPATVPGQSLSVADASASEGGTAAFAVTMDRGATGTATVDYATSDGTATAGVDYTAASGTLTFAAGESSKTVAVPLLADAEAESHETFALTLSNATGAGLDDASATGTVRDVPPAAKRPALSISDTVAPEGGTASFELTLDPAADGDVEAFHTTVSRTATAGIDFTGVYGTLTFAAGETSKTVDVDVLDDEEAEFDETFRLELISVRGADYADPTGVATILDDDAPLARLHSVPAEHGGQGQAFEAGLEFDEEIADVGYVWVRDTLATAANGTVARAQRVVPDPPRNRRWTLTVEPSSSADVTLSLASGLRLPDGRPLRVGGAATVRGPAAKGASVDGARLTLVWPSARDGFGTPSGTDWAVAVNGVPRAVASAEIAGRRAVLVLSAPVAGADAVTVGYVGSAMHPLANASGSVRSAPWDGVAARNVTVVGADGTNGSGSGDLPAPPSGPPAARFAAAPPDAVRLDASGLGLADLAMLAPFTALERLDLSDNALADLSGIGAHAGLRELDLSGNRVADLGPLRALEALERLDLSGNLVIDIAPLAGLPALAVLVLDGNAVADLGALTHLAALEHLSLADNAVPDVTPLQDLQRLRRLDLGGNPVADLSPLGDVGSLEWLSLPGEPEAAADALVRLTGLRWVWPGAAPARDGTAR